MKPIEVLVFVAGGNVQQAFASQKVNITVYDLDNFENGMDEEQQKSFIDTYGHPDTWEEMIKQKTQAGEIVSIY